MSPNFASCLAFTLTQEGGWSNNPRDPGGATMKGITYREFLRWHPGATLTALKHISDADVAAIYHTDYWNAVRGDALPLGVDLMCFDFGVNSGPGRANMELQAALGVTRDGILGPITFAAAAKASASSLITVIGKMQREFYRGLDDYDEFGDGWEARTDRRVAAALKLAVKTTAPIVKQNELKGHTP